MISIIAPGSHIHTFRLQLDPNTLIQYGKLVNNSGQGVEKINDDIKKIHQSETNNYDATIDALKVRKRIEYLKTDGCERIKRDYNKKKSERYWDDEIYHQRSSKKSRIMEEIKNVAETYKICKRILVKIFLVCLLPKLK